ncbi:MAG: STAS domain-containing protein [Bryobacteraceae bacterium]
MAETAQIRSVGNTPVIDLQGKITLGESSTQVREATDQLLAQGKSRILLNMSAVPYVDSAGLGAIASCHVKALGAGGGISLFQVTQRVTELLKLTRMNEKLAIFPDEEAALASLASQGSNS